MDWKDMVKKLKGIKYRSEKDWEILIPFKKAQAVQDFILICRECEVVDWHIVFSEPVGDSYPEIRIYWDRGNIH